MPSEGTQVPTADQLLILSKEDMMGIKAVAQVALGGPNSPQGPLHLKRLMQGLSASES